MSKTQFKPFHIPEVEGVLTRSSVSLDCQHLSAARFLPLKVCHFLPTENLPDPQSVLRVHLSSLWFLLNIYKEKKKNMQRTSQHLRFSC